MPRLGIRTEKRQTPGDSPRSYVLVRLEGLIDAPNFLAFETALEKLLRANEVRVVLDFRGVQYINSTGISSLIRYHGAFTERGGGLTLIQVGRNVGLTMHLLGVTSIVPFLKNLTDAEQHLAEGRTGVPDADFLEVPGYASASERIAASEQTASSEHPRRVPVLVERPAKVAGTVVLLVPRVGPFTKIFRHRLSNLNGKYHLVHTLDELKASLDRWQPDLVVLDRRAGQVDEFIEGLRTTPGRSLTSVIVLYEKGADVRSFSGFRVWENDYLVDPFELMNLFVLTERELQRVPRDRRIFSQQVQFQFSSDQASLERSLQLTNQLIHSLNLSESYNTALYAAVKEAIDNAVKHGNQYKSDARVTVNFLVDQRKVTVIVEDEGQGFDYEYFLSQIDSQEAFERAKQRIRSGARGGLGILLMHKCADRLEYSGSGNVLRLEKNLESTR